MRLITALVTGVFAYLVVGAATDSLPALRPGTWRANTGTSRRQTWLVQAGTDLTPRQFALGSLAAGVVTFVLGWAITAAPAVAVVPAAAVGLAPRAYFARRRAARLRDVAESWPDGIRDLQASISAGLSLNQAIESLAATGPQPLRRAFARYPQLSRMLGVVPALEVVKEELADPTSDRVIEVLILAHERGGHILSSILSDLASATTQDLRAREEITTAGLEQKINARAVFVLPWLVLVALTVQDGPFRDFYRSVAGVLVVIAGGVLSLIGMWVVGRLARRPDEARVFGSATRGAVAPMVEGPRP